MTHVLEWLHFAKSGAISLFVLCCAVIPGQRVALVECYDNLRQATVAGDVVNLANVDPHEFRGNHRSADPVCSTIICKDFDIHRSTVACLSLEGNTLQCTIDGTDGARERQCRAVIP